MSDIFEVERLRQSLEALGQTAEAVAVSLYERGIRGVPGSSYGCPINVFLRSLMVDQIRIGMTTEAYTKYYVTLGMTTADVKSVVHKIHHPPPVQEFIQNFDNKVQSHYTFLVG